MDKPNRSTRHYTPGEVHPSVLYRADELKARMGWSESAFRSARHAGLEVSRVGKRVYVLGDDVITYLKQQRKKPYGREGSTSCANQ